MFFEAGREARHSADCRRSGEAAVLAALLQQSCAPKLVFDIGANLGEWTSLLLETARESRKQIEVHAFEPCSGTYQQLAGRIRAAGWCNVRAVPLACSSRSGKATMSVYAVGAGTNSIVEKIDHESASREEVDVTSIDDYCAANGIGHVDFIKIDTEGNDFEVLLGTRGLLETGKVELVQFEYNWRWIGARRFLRDAFALLQPRGYAIGKITPGGVEFYAHWCPELESYREGNYIACKKDGLAALSPLKPSWLDTDAVGW